MLQKYISALLLFCGLLSCLVLAVPRQGSANSQTPRRRSETQREKCLRACRERYNNELAACQSTQWGQRKACEKEANDRYIQCRVNCPH